jgi:hypothetical protein
MQNGFSPYEAETQDIDQRRKYAELLRQQGMAPLQAHSVGGMNARISPFEGLAKMLNAYSGSKGVENAAQERKDLMGRMDTERSTAMAEIIKAYGGTPARPQVMGADDTSMLADQGGEANPMTQAVQGDPNQAAMIALQSRLPDVRQMAPGLMNIGETRQNRTEDREFRQSEREARVADEMRRLEVQLREGRITREQADARAAELRRDMQQQGFQQQQTMASVAAANRPQPQAQVITTDTGIYERNRDGTLKQLIDPATGKPLMPKAPAGKAGKTDVDKTMDLYMAASNGLISGLSKTTTGPLAGRLPATTTQAQVGEGAVAAMAPVLKQLFRVAGEGTFTDQDQKLLLDMVPTRKDTPEARKQKMSNIDSIVAAKLGLPIPDRGEKSTPITAAPSPVDALLDKYK